MSPQTLYIASSNPGKLRDFQTAAAAFPAAASEPQDASAFELALLPGLAAIPAPPEDADSFEGNARDKAIYYSLHAPGSIVIADDSGLEVDALDGAPGVYSARYAERADAPPFSPGAELSVDARNNKHLLEELARALTPLDLLANLDHRSARYRCVLVAARDGMKIASADGTVEGLILLEPRGSGGFGYDPLFYLPEQEQTMAELDPVARFGLNHRGRALRALLPRLARLPS